MPPRMAIASPFLAVAERGLVCLADIISSAGAGRGRGRPDLAGEAIHGVLERASERSHLSIYKEGWG